MRGSVLRWAPWPEWSWAAVWRCCWKGLVFGAFVALVLNPNLKRAFLQVQHTLHPEALIQTHFPALPLINAEVDRWVAADGGQHSEARLVARFVLKKIQYVSDYENWDNIEYWPTAEEAWQKRQEDCDGRAILTTSILRSRGFPSARMVIGLDHMWVRVNENEKDPSKPAHVVSLLSPNPDFSLDLPEQSSWREFLEIMKALLHPAALRDTLGGLFADIPSLRKAVLIVGLLLLCYHPCKNRTGLLAVVALGLAAANLLAHWEPGKGELVQVTSGAGVLLIALTLALLMNRILARPEPLAQAAAGLPECEVT
jgi:hypothetical protein